DPPLDRPGGPHRPDRRPRPGARRGERSMTGGIDETAEREALLSYLSGIGLDCPIVAYPAHSSVEEGKRLRGDLPGAFTKNLLLRDKKDGLFFVTAHEDSDIDLKTLHTRIRARGR